MSKQLTIIIKDDAHEHSAGDIMAALINAVSLVLNGSLKRHDRGWYIVSRTKPDDPTG